MGENKYLRAMQQANEHIGKQAEPAPLPKESSEPEAPAYKPTRSAGRPPGKRSSPDWEQVTLFIRKETKRAALLRLMDDQSGKDLSEIIEQLLSRWATIP